jgi:hypothetical protein
MGPPSAPSGSPLNLSPPLVSGTTIDGQTLSADPGSWQSDSPLSFDFQWQRCDANGAGCLPIAGASAQSYGLTPDDVGSTLVVVVTATSSDGSSSASSAAVGPVAPPPPAVVRWPHVSGLAQVGQTLSSTNGTWNGTPPFSFRYQWRRCDAALAACVDIAGATDQSYTLVPADVGSRLRLRVFATNAAGTSYQSSSPTAVVVGAPPAGPCGWASNAPPVTYDHVVWIVMENKSYSQVFGSPYAPYLNTLAGQCGVAANFTAAANASLPSYIALTSGSTQGIADSGGPASHPLAVPSIFSQVNGDWRSLQESMPSNCYLVDSGLYTVRHNPAAYYTNIAGECANQDVPLGAVPDLSARFTFVTPNLCSDMHACPTTPDTPSQIAAGDGWLSGFMPMILNSPEYLAGSTAVFITFDEGSPGDNHILTVVISPYTQAGTLSTDAFTHYSILRTSEEMLGLTPFLGDAATAASMRSAFHF